MIKRIWVEVLRHVDGCAKFSSRGQLFRAKLGGADGPVLCKRTITPMLAAVAPCLPAAPRAI
jgi:hypothetical protein